MGKVFCANCQSGVRYEAYLKYNISFRFSEDSILFQCRYSRSVSISSEFTVSPSSDDPITGHGDLTYSMNVDAGSLGGNSVVTISPNHKISGIGARLVIPDN